MQIIDQLIAPTSPEVDAGNATIRNRAERSIGFDAAYSKAGSKRPEQPEPASERDRAGLPEGAGPNPGDVQPGEILADPVGLATMPEPSVSIDFNSKHVEFGAALPMERDGNAGPPDETTVAASRLTGPGIVPASGPDNFLSAADSKAVALPSVAGQTPGVILQASSSATVLSVDKAGTPELIKVGTTENPAKPGADPEAEAFLPEARRTDAETPGRPLPAGATVPRMNILETDTRSGGREPISRPDSRNPEAIRVAENHFPALPPASEGSQPTAFPSEAKPVEQNRDGALFREAGSSAPSGTSEPAEPGARYRRQPDDAVPRNTSEAGITGAQTDKSAGQTNVADPLRQVALRNFPDAAVTDNPDAVPAKAIELLQTELRGISRSGGPVSAGNPVAQSVSGQITTSITGATDGKIELHLRPAELGRLIIQLSPTDSGLSAVISADRPEVSDMFRRHSEIFRRDLSELGFTNISLDFEARDNGAKTEQPHHIAHDTAPLGEEPEDGAVVLTRTVSSGLASGLDIRI